jgi:hypothetical protein
MIAIELFSCARRSLGKLSAQKASATNPIQPAPREFDTIASPENILRWHRADAVAASFLHKVDSDSLRSHWPSSNYPRITIRSKFRQRLMSDTAITRRDRNLKLPNPWRKLGHKAWVRISAKIASHSPSHQRILRSHHSNLWGANFQIIFHNFFVIIE